MIPDFHVVPAGWGIRPVLFTLAGHPVASYSVFVTVGLIAAVLLYYFNVRNKTVGNNGLYIALAAAIGGIIGSKLPIWVANVGAILANPGRIDLLLSGRTIVGGLIGGALGVYLTKKRLHITARLGNYLVPSLCIGIFFGRIGCFLAGCCYGVATSLPWGVDFGDGVLRHPTQLYEALFVLGLFVYAQVMKDRYEPGRLFRVFMITYFVWRFLIEFIRVNPVWVMGLTYYQVAAAGVVVYYVARLVFRTRQVQGEGVPE
jgi:phosphatidylglycerol:prolipoprotein diacylglycerol transferase